MTDAANPSPPRHTGGKFRKGVSGNPGGKKRVIPAPQEAPQGRQAPQAAHQEGIKPQTHAEVEQPVNASGKRDTRFKPGNPGKPKGTRHHATRLAEALIDGQAQEIVQKAIAMAVSGDPTALRVVMDRLCPPRRERTISITMPKINSVADLIMAAAALTDATASGDITPSEAASLSALVSNVAKAIETVEIVARLERLEEQFGTKGLTP
jgi:hypothetical protein